MNAMLLVILLQCGSPAHAQITLVDGHPLRPRDMLLDRFVAFDPSTGRTWVGLVDMSFRVGTIDLDPTLEFEGYDKDFKTSRKFSINEPEADGPELFTAIDGRLYVLQVSHKGAKLLVRSCSFQDDGSDFKVGGADTLASDRPDRHVLYGELVHSSPDERFVLVTAFTGKRAKSIDGFVYLLLDRQLKALTMGNAHFDVPMEYEPSLFPSFTAEGRCVISILEGCEGRGCPSKVEGPQGIVYRLENGTAGAHRIKPEGAMLGTLGAMAADDGRVLVAGSSSLADGTGSALFSCWISADGTVGPYSVRPLSEDVATALKLRGPPLRAYAKLGLPEVTPEVRAELAERVTPNLSTRWFGKGASGTYVMVAEAFSSGTGQNGYSEETGNCLVLCTSATGEPLAASVINRNIMGTDPYNRFGSLVVARVNDRPVLLYNGWQGMIATNDQHSRGVAAAPSGPDPREYVILATAIEASGELTTTKPLPEGADYRSGHALSTGLNVYRGDLDPVLLRTGGKTMNLVLLSGGQ